MPLLLMLSAAILLTTDGWFPDQHTVGLIVLVGGLVWWALAIIEAEGAETPFNKIAGRRRL